MNTDSTVTRNASSRLTLTLNGQNCFATDNRCMNSYPLIKFMNKMLSLPGLNYNKLQHD